MGTSGYLTRRAATLPVRQPIWTAFAHSFVHPTIFASQLCGHLGAGLKATLAGGTYAQPTQYGPEPPTRVCMPMSFFSQTSTRSRVRAFFFVPGIEPLVDHERKL
jgi:hypothetical protein